MRQTMQEVVRENQTVTTRQQWEHPEHGHYFVVGIGVETESGDVRIGLSGPGPCRSYRQVDIDDLLREWKLVNEG